MPNQKLNYFKNAVAGLFMLTTVATAQTSTNKAECTVSNQAGCATQPTAGNACASVCATLCDPSACAISANWEDPAVNAQHVHYVDSDKNSDIAILDGNFETFRSRYKVPALVGAVANSSGLVAAGHSGVRVAGASELIVLTDKFHLGSCTKAVTATLAGILNDEGLISFQTTIGEAFPELKEIIHPEFRAVTLLELLSHRTGVPQLERGPDSDMWKELMSYQGTPKDQRALLVKTVLRNKPTSMRGAKFIYSDMGYTIAGAMLEHVTGESYEELVSQRLAKPLGITTLGFGAPGSISANDQPRGHVLKSSALESLAPGTYGDLAAPIISPAGTVHMSITDWSKLTALQLKGKSQSGEELLSKSTLKQLHSDIYEQNYALGWGVSQVTWSKEKVYSHTGSCGAWSAAVWVVPERDLVFVAASNYGGAEGFSAVSDALTFMIEKYIGPTGVASK